MVVVARVVDDDSTHTLHFRHKIKSVTQLIPITCHYHRGVRVEGGGRKKGKKENEKRREGGGAEAEMKKDAAATAVNLQTKG